SQELETMADCFAGAWSRDAEQRGRLGNFDIEENIAQYALAFNDTESGAADPGAHGRGALRVYWFLDGYYFGATSCLDASPATARHGERRRPRRRRRAPRRCRRAPSARSAIATNRVR